MLKISVITYVKNRFDYRLENCLKSLRNQNYPASLIEIILVDYGSKEKDVEGLKALCLKCGAKYIRVGGVSFWNKAHALNIGIKKAEGDCILTADIDIIFEKNYIKECVLELEKNRRQVIWRDPLDLDEHDVSQNTDVLSEYEKLEAKSVLRSELRNSNYTFGLGIIMALKKYFFDIRGYDEFYKGWGYEDDDIIKRFLMLGLKIKNIKNKSSYLHQWHENSRENRQRTLINKWHFENVKSFLRNPVCWGKIVQKKEWEETIKKIHLEKLSEIVVVSCYFNPCQSKLRKQNYKIFREQVIKTGVRFLTVELAFGSAPFQLSEFLEAMGVRTSESNIMWQKERLLNIGIKKMIEEGYKKIVWLDADIVFENKNWLLEISRKLDRHNLVQVFRSVKRDDEQGKPRKFFGIARNVCLKKDVSGVFAATGFGWAACSKTLEDSLLYDAAIIGGGDAMIFFASHYSKKEIVQLEHETVFKKIPDKFLSHYFEWAEKWRSLVGGKIGFANCNIKALYHGKVSDRNYEGRHLVLASNVFDPKKDIVLSKENVWEWASLKPGLRKQVKEYFCSRKEG